VPRWQRWWLRLVHGLFVDPDGRPRGLHRTDEI
jgi:hypothetical protein